MIIQVKNLTATVLPMPAEINILDSEIPALGVADIFNNEDDAVCPINPISNIQNCCPLKDFIQEDKVVFVVNGVEATKAQSLNILNPVINFP